jgi:hypothetical protein
LQSIAGNIVHTSYHAARLLALILQADTAAMACSGLYHDLCSKTALVVFTCHCPACHNDSQPALQPLAVSWIERMHDETLLVCLPVLLW